MKLSTIPVVLAGAAGLASAAPILIYASPPPAAAKDFSSGWVKNIRLGHAAANARNLPALEPYTVMPMPSYATPTPTGPWVAQTTGWSHPKAGQGEFPWNAPVPTREYTATIQEYSVHIQEHPAPVRPWGPTRGSQYMNKLILETRVSKGKGGCRMKGMRTKSLQWGNKLRVILGLPPIKGYHHWPQIEHSIVNMESPMNQRGAVYSNGAPVWFGPVHHRHVHSSDNLPFMARLTHALATLGPWEGRAVSFVLGCGLGVLLRMLFVFSVLIVRAVRCRREQRRRIALEEDTVIFVADMKEPIAVETLPVYAEKTEEPQTNDAP